MTLGPLVRSIGRRAFSGCFCLTALDLPRALRTIGANAFNSCNSLSEVSLPDRVGTVGSGAFAHCRQLATLSAARGTRLGGGRGQRHQGEGHQVALTRAGGGAPQRAAPKNYDWPNKPFLRYFT